MIRGFQITALVLIGVAAYFLWTQNKDGVFLSLVMAACSFFMSVRFQAKARIEQRAAENREEVLNK